MDAKPYISLKTWDMKAESTLKKDRKITERTVVTTWNSLKTFWIYAIQQKYLPFNCETCAWIWLNCVDCSQSSMQSLLLGT